MKVRWLLVASLFMAMFAFMSAVPSASAASGVVLERKIALTPEGSDYFAHGVADYKVYAGGASSLAISVQGAQSVRFQTLYVGLEDSNDQDVATICTMHIGVNGNGSCVVDTRTGATLPTILSGDYIEVLTSTPAVDDEYLEGQF